MISHCAFMQKPSRSHSAGGSRPCKSGCGVPPFASSAEPWVCRQLWSHRWQTLALEYGAAWALGICHCQAAGSHFVHGFSYWAKQRVTKLCDGFGSIKAKQITCSYNSNWFTGWSIDPHRVKRTQCVQEVYKPKNTQLWAVPPSGPAQTLTGSILT